MEVIQRLKIRDTVIEQMFVLKPVKKNEIREREEWLKMGVERDKHKVNSDREILESVKSGIQKIYQRVKPVNSKYRISFRISTDGIGTDSMNEHVVDVLSQIRKSYRLYVVSIDIGCTICVVELMCSKDDALGIYNMFTRLTEDAGSFRIQHENSME